MTLKTKSVLILGILTGQAIAGLASDHQDKSEARLGAFPVIDWAVVYNNVFSPNGIASFVTNMVVNFIVSVTTWSTLAFFYTQTNVNAKSQGPEFVGLAGTRHVRDVPDNPDVAESKMPFTGKSLAMMLRSFADSAEGFDRYIHLSHAKFHIVITKPSCQSTATPSHIICKSCLQI